MTPTHWLALASLSLLAWEAYTLRRHLKLQRETDRKGSSLQEQINASRVIARWPHLAFSYQQRKAAERVLGSLKADSPPILPRTLHASHTIPFQEFEVVLQVLRAIDAIHIDYTGITISSEGSALLVELSRIRYANERLS